MLLSNLYCVQSRYGLVYYYKNDYWFTNNDSKKIFEEDLIVKYLSPIIKKSRIALDIGAHAGSHSIVYATLNNNLRVYAFEPQKKMFDLLKFNVKNHNSLNIEVFNCAVGHKLGITTLDTKIHEPEGDVDLSYDPNTSSNLGGVGFGPGGESVNVVSIDSLQLEICDFIKIDVEGAENLVILGGHATIKRFRPLIFFESNHTKMTPETLTAMGIYEALPSATQMLRNLGYSRIFKIDSNNFLAAHAGQVPLKARLKLFMHGIRLID
jgi:FkbM family methyltransferase